MDYTRIERSRPFLDAIQRLEREVRNHRIALLCSEEDPTGCHRRLLVGRVLGERGIAVRHIRGDGSLQARAKRRDQPVLFPDEVSVRNLYIGFTKKAASGSLGR